jgi:MYXO-CTERM domain-containing protein
MRVTNAPVLLCSLLALAAAPAGAPPLRPEHIPDADPALRHAWWHQQRAYPAADIPEGAHARARAAYHAARHRPRSGAKLTWKPIGPAPLDTTYGMYETPNMSPSAGRASAIAVDPTDSKIIYAGYAMGGVWKTIDGGKSWTPLMDLEPTLAVGAIALDPAAPGTLYVGTGEPAPYIGYAGQGIFKSTDGGATFAPLATMPFDGLVVSRLVLDGAVLYASTMFGAEGRGVNCNSAYDAKGQGVYRSDDDGKTWTLLKAGKIVDLEVDVSVTPRRLLISDYATGAFLSEDGGATWIAPVGLPTAQSSPRGSRIELSFSAANPAIVYAGLGLGGQAAIFVSSDGGKTFAAMPGAPDYCQTQCYYDNAVLADPVDEKTLYVGGGLCGIWKTSDATSATPTWVNVSLPAASCQGGAVWFDGYVHPDVHALAFDPKDHAVVFTASDGGIARSGDGGATWAQLNDGVGTLQIYALCGHPQDPTVIYGGAQDSGILARGSESLTWRGIIAADGGPCAVDAADPKTVLASNEYAAVVRTQDAFASAPTYVFDATPGECQSGEPGCGDRVSFIAPLVGDPGTPGTYYIGTHRLWKSAAGGTKDSWKAISPDLTAGKKSVKCPDAASFGAADDTLTAVAVAPSAPGILYTGSQTGRISASVDGGLTWTRVDKAPLPSRWVSSLAVDPRDGNIVYAGFSGFDASTPATPGHVFRSTDAGGTWEARGIGMDTPVDTLLAHPVASDLLYAGTDFGVLVTTDGGKSWAPLGEALPHVAVYSLLYQRAASALVAGTFGRSAWQLPLPPGSLTVTPAKLSFTIAAGKGAPPAQTIAVGDDDPRGSIVSFTASAAAPWAALDHAAGDAAGATPVALAVTITRGTLAAGEHDTSVTITPKVGGKAILVPVHLTIEAGAVVPEAKGCGCRVGAGQAGAPAGALGVVALLGLLRRRRERVGYRR